MIHLLNMNNLLALISLSEIFCCSSQLIRIQRWMLLGWYQSQLSPKKYLKWNGMHGKDLYSILIFGLLILLVFGYSIYIFFKYVKTHQERLIDRNVAGKS